MSSTHALSTPALRTHLRQLLPSLVFSLTLVAMVEVFPSRSAAADTIDLSRYVRVGRYDLPEPTRTTAPSGSLLAQEASNVTYNWDTDTLFLSGDGGTAIVQVSKTGQLIDSMSLAPGSSPQGTEFYDTEGLTYIGNGEFVLTEERDRQLVRFTYVAGTTLQRTAAKTVKLGTSLGNVGFEGLCWDPSTSGFLVVKEKTPISIFQTTVDFNAGTASNGSPTATASTDLFDPALAGTTDFSDVFALSNLPALNGTPEASHLLIISQESGQVVKIGRDGTVYSRLTIIADAGSVLSVPDMTMEGVTMDRSGHLYITNENGGGDASHPQLWVYAPSTAENLAPTALTLQNPTSSLPENTSTAAAVQVARLLITDDGVGVNTLALSGADAAAFQIIGTSLFLKAGTTLNFTTKPTYSVVITVDDTSVGTTPDASTGTYTLTITAPTGGTPQLIISEVAPWSSGNSSAGADWFEVTNIGTATANITGWKVDDSSNAFASAVALNGITSIAPGESVLFIESIALANLVRRFTSVWFGNTPPAGLQVGTYTGSGIGLGTGGDSVILFDSAGAVQARVDFGANAPTAPGPFATFDNAAGLNNTLLNTLSAVGINGAFAVTDTNGNLLRGSPGTLGDRATPTLSISATDAAAAELDANPGTFRITRTGSTASSLTANYTIALGAGQAVAADYTPTLTGAVVIPAGQNFVNITLTPVADALNEGPETITLTLFDTGSYDVGSPATATITLADTPLQTWRLLYFNTSANTDLAADSADFDGDGVPNLIEYALGSDPTAALSTPSLPVATVAYAKEPLLSDRLALTITLPDPFPADLTYTVEASSDLITWTPVASMTGSPPIWAWLGGGTSRIEYTGKATVIPPPPFTFYVGDLVPTEGNPVRLLRLRVTTP